MEMKISRVKRAPYKLRYYSGSVVCVIPEVFLAANGISAGDRVVPFLDQENNLVFVPEDRAEGYK